MARDMSRSERAKKRAKARRERRKARKLTKNFPGCLGLYPDKECQEALPWEPSSECAYKKIDEEGETYFISKCPYFDPEGVEEKPENIDEEMKMIVYLRKQNNQKRENKGGW